MSTLTGRNTRTLTGYVATLLDYPRWIIERQVDFTDCHLSGGFDETDTRCSACRFGAACSWLNTNRMAPSPDTPLEELLLALHTAIDYLRTPSDGEAPHPGFCDCPTCSWLREARGFLRTHRHRT
jgi:hypothetical protein